MKKVILVLLAIMFVATMAYALEPKVNYFYEADNSEFLKLVGTSVKEDVADIKGLDIDLWYNWTKTDIKYDEVGLNNLVMPGISYSREVNGFDVGLNAGAGFDRIEDYKDVGEFKYGIGICIGKKF